MKSKPKTRLIFLTFLIFGCIFFHLRAEAVDITFFMNTNSIWLGNSVRVSMPNNYLYYNWRYGRGFYGFGTYPYYYYSPFVSFPQIYRPVTLPTANPYEELMWNKKLAQLSEIKKADYLTLKSKEEIEARRWQVTPQIKIDSDSKELPQIKVNDDNNEYQPKETQIIENGSVVMKSY